MQRVLSYTVSLCHRASFVIHLFYFVHVMKALNMFAFVEDWVTKEREEEKIWSEYWKHLFPRNRLQQIRSSPSFISSSFLQMLKEHQKTKLKELALLKKFSHQDLVSHSSSFVHAKKEFSTLKEKETEMQKHRDSLRDSFHDKNTKLIISCPGGLHVTYMLGTVLFMREMYPTSSSSSSSSSSTSNSPFLLQSFVFSGASAGAWCSLFFCYRKNLRELILAIFADMLPIPKDHHVSLFNQLIKLKTIILKHSSTEDYDLSRLFIGCLSLDSTSCQVTTRIHCEFQDLEDALNCCIASSNIPFLTGSWNQTYQNEIAWDGAFSSYPYLNLLSPSFVLSPNMWNIETRSKGIERYTSMFSLTSLDFLATFWQGYNDAMIHRSIFSVLFSTSC